MEFAVCDAALIPIVFNAAAEFEALHVPVSATSPYEDIVCVLDAACQILAVNCKAAFNHFLPFQNISANAIKP